MAATISRLYGPTTMQWSKNPIQYILGYNGFTAGRSIEVQVIDSSSNVVLAQTEYVISDTSGVLVINGIEKMIDPYLRYQVPNPGIAGGQAIPDTLLNKKTVHLKYREYYTGATTNFIEDTANKFIVMKGGIGSMNFYDEYIHNDTNQYGKKLYPIDERAFMTFLPNMVAVSPKQRGWLLYHHKDDDKPRVWYNIIYADGTSALIKRDLHNTGSPPYKNRMWYIPYGIEQAVLDPIGKKVSWYNVQVVTENLSGGATKNYGKIEFRPDYRKEWGSINLVYRNGSGGLDSIMLTGVNQIGGAEFDKRLMERPRYSAYAVQGAEQHYYSEGRLSFKANTGYIQKNLCPLIYELYNTVDHAAIWYNGQWLPVQIPAQEMKPKSVKDMLHSYDIEFMSAGGFQAFPRQLTDLMNI